MRSDATEREMFTKLLKNELTDADIVNGEFDDEGKRLRWYGIKNQNSDRALAAKAAERTRARQEKNDLYTEETRTRAKVQTISEGALDTLYANNALTPEMIDRSKASPAMKRTYRSMVEKKVQVEKARAIELNTEMLDAQILNNLGEWDNKELLNFIDRGLTADEVHTWQQRNKEIKDDPSNFRHSLVYKQGLKDLYNSKQNLLFIGGPGQEGNTNKTKLVNDNRNTEEYLKILRQFENESSRPDADPDEILMRLKKPYLDAVPETFFERIKSAVIGAETEESPEPKVETQVEAAEKRATPTLDEFLKKARAVNPNVSEPDLIDYYENTYGGT